jgi:hypothetical protein
MPRFRVPNSDGFTFLPRLCTGEHTIVALARAYPVLTEAKFRRLFFFGIFN